MDVRFVLKYNTFLPYKGRLRIMISFHLTVKERYIMYDYLTDRCYTEHLAWKENSVWFLSLPIYPTIPSKTRMIVWWLYQELEDDYTQVWWLCSDWVHYNPEEGRRGWEGGEVRVRLLRIGARRAGLGGWSWEERAGRAQWCFEPIWVPINKYFQNAFHLSILI